MSNRHVGSCYIFLGVVKYRFIKSSLCQNVCKLRVKPDHGWKIGSPKVCLVCLSLICKISDFMKPVPSAAEAAESSGGTIMRYGNCHSHNIHEM